MTYSVPAHDPAMAAHPAAEPTQIGSAVPHRFTRPGERPVAFSGTEMAMAMSFTPELPYWYEIAVYRTDDQRFVLAIRLFFQSEDEDDVSQAWVFDSLFEAFDAIQAYDAGKDVKVAFDDTSMQVPADMMASALELRARVAAARMHYAGLVGEFFSELDRAAA